jgi:serine phosphatase RsbU (regulator of sigma subunit)
MDELGAEDVTRLRLETGDILCIVSDGIIEAAAPSGELYGAERLSALLADRSDDPPGRASPTRSGARWTRSRTAPSPTTIGRC